MGDATRGQTALARTVWARWPKMATRRPQASSGMAPNWPPKAPRWPKMATRWPQHVTEWPQNGPRENPNMGPSSGHREALPRQVELRWHLPWRRRAWGRLRAILRRGGPTSGRCAPRWGFLWGRCWGTVYHAEANGSPYWVCLGPAWCHGGGNVEACRSLLGPSRPLAT